MQFSLRLKDSERARVEALIGTWGATRYEVVRRVFLLGLERIETGDAVRKSVGETVRDRRIEDLLELIRRDLEVGRARDFNLCLDNLETRAWLRTLGEVLVPNSMTTVKTKVQNSRSHFFSLLENLPPDAPGLEAAEDD